MRSAAHFGLSFRIYPLVSESPEFPTSNTHSNPPEIGSQTAVLINQIIAQASISGTFCRSFRTLLSDLSSSLRVFRVSHFKHSFSNPPISFRDFCFLWFSTSKRRSGDLRSSPISRVTSIRCVLPLIFRTLISDLSSQSQVSRVSHFKHSISNPPPYPSCAYFLFPWFPPTGEDAETRGSVMEEKIVVYDGNTSFARDMSITGFTVADGVTEIGVAAFVGCTGLTSLEGLRSTGVTTICKGAFGLCTGLTSLGFARKNQRSRRRIPVQAWGGLICVVCASKFARLEHNIFNVQQLL